MAFVSIFDIFKIGIGPSSSHTMGPMVAAKDFISSIKNLELIDSIQITLYGSLSKTGIGHGTNIAVMLGLIGLTPKTVETSNIKNYIKSIKQNKTILLNSLIEIKFDAEKDIIFSSETKVEHPNTLTFRATLKNGQVLTETFYSVGGGFILKKNATQTKSEETSVPHPIETEKDLINAVNKFDCSISDLVFQNEISVNSPKTVRLKLLEVWQMMLDSVYRGCHNSGFLPGGLNVVRRAYKLNASMLHAANYVDAGSWLDEIRKLDLSFAEINNLVSCFALAVNEENAAFGRIVTAPTNGSAGVIPAVLLYFLLFCKNKGEADICKFLLTASEIGSLFKKGSTLSAAMGGCQAEVGVSSAMAAGALTECLHGDAEYTLMAAEIAMEHHLGLTCDPVKGLVQIPCIERNAIGAHKAITASQLALSRSKGKAKVTLDDVIKAMKETALNMNTRYKETSEGGLAINVAIPEC